MSQRTRALFRPRRCGSVASCLVALHPAPLQFAPLMFATGYGRCATCAISSAPIVESPRGPRYVYRMGDTEEEGWPGELTFLAQLQRLASRVFSDLKTPLDPLVRIVSVSRDAGDDFASRETPPSSPHAPLGTFASALESRARAKATQDRVMGVLAGRDVQTEATRSVLLEHMTWRDTASDVISFCARAGSVAAAMSSRSSNFHGRSLSAWPRVVPGTSERTVVTASSTRPPKRCSRRPTRHSADQALLSTRTPHRSSVEAANG